MARRPTPLPENDGRQRWSNTNDFDWNLGARRRLKRLLTTGLRYREIAMLMGVSKGAISSAVARYGLTLSPEELRARQLTAGLERATHGQRVRRESSWETKLTESWEERKARVASERAAQP